MGTKVKLAEALQELTWVDMNMLCESLVYETTVESVGLSLLDWAEEVLNEDL